MEEQSTSGSEAIEASPNPEPQPSDDTKSSADDTLSDGKAQLARYVLLSLFGLLLVVVVGGYLYRQLNANANSNIARLEVELNDNFYGSENNNMEVPPVWRARRNSPVQVHVVNRGELNHNWAIVRQDETLPIPFTEGQSSDKIMFTAGMVYGDNETTLTFFAPDVGVYQVICTVEGHYPFMQGQLIVE